jgi:hypothetical protein
MTLKRAALPVVVAIGCSGLLFAASLATTFVDRSAIRAHVNAAFNAEETRTAEYNKYHYHQCLILFMLLAPYDTRVQEVLFPKIPQGWNPCHRLQVQAETGDLGGIYTYERYWHGIRTFMAPLVSHFEIGSAVAILRTAGYVALGLALAALLWRKRWQEEDTDATPLVGVGLAFIVCVALFYATPIYYGTCLAFGVADLSICMLLAATALTNRGTSMLRTTLVVATLFGAVISYVEFLTGHAPLGLTVLLAATAAGARTQSSAVLAQRCLWAAYAFMCGFLIPIGARIAALLFSGADTGRFFSMLLYRMGGAVSSEIASAFGTRFGIDLSQHAMYSPHMIFVAGAEIVNATRILGQGSLALGLSAVLLGLAGSTWGTWARWHRLQDGHERVRTAIMAGAALIMPAWYLVFLNHTIFHAPFMIRPLVGFVAIGLWFGATEIRAVVLGWRARETFVGLRA